jgi:hypothetical protein
MKLHVADNPWGLVAFGALAGVWLASHRERSEVAEPPGVILGVLGGLALRVIRDVALYEMTRIVKTFVAPEPEPPPTPYAS